MELISPHSSPLACQQPPQSVASTKMTTVSLVPQNPQPVMGSRPALKTAQMTLKIQPSTVRKAGANLSPNSSTGWSKGSQDPAGSAGSPETVSGHIPQPSDPRPGKPLPPAQEEHSRCFSTQNRPRPSGSGTQQVLNEPRSDWTLDVGTLLLAIKLNHLRWVQGPHSGQLGTLRVSSTTTQPPRAAHCWSLTNGQQLLVGVNSVIILRS